MSENSRRPLQPLPPLSPEERARNLAVLRGSKPEPGPVWVFAYASLIWDPCFACAAADTAVLDGYRRAFNFWSVLSRGTPERPGLGLGLERGGHCRGVAYRLAETSLEADLEAIWRREMYSAVYEPRWLPVRTDAGLRHAIGFVTDTGHGQYADGLSAEAAARIIAEARGENGPCRDYLDATIAALAAHGIDDQHLNDLAALVDGRDRHDDHEGRRRR